MSLIPVLTSPALAQVFSWEWFTQDRSGQLIAAAVIAVVGLVLLFLLLKSLRWAAARLPQVLGGAAVVAAIYVGSVYLFNLGPMGWAIGGMIAFGAFVGFALWMTHAGSSR